MGVQQTGLTLGCRAALHLWRRFVIRASGRWAAGYFTAYLALVREGHLAPGFRRRGRLVRLSCRGRTGALAVRRSSMRGIVPDRLAGAIRNMQTRAPVLRPDGCPWDTGFLGL
jgi:hypothetical protein